MRDTRLWWDGCGGIGVPPARWRLIPLGKNIRSEGWVFSRKKDKPTQRGEAGPAPPRFNPSVGRAVPLPAAPVLGWLARG